MKTIAIVLLPLLACACMSETTPDTQGPMDPEQLVARGEHLVNSIGCDDCHSPKIMTDHGPEPDLARRLSGHPSDLTNPSYPAGVLSDWVLFNQQFTSMVGPWGTSFAANISSDDTGIGLWSEEQFFRAIREGKYKGMANGRDLLPPMPWPSYSKLEDEDLRAIFAFLKSTEPVRNIVPSPIPPALAGPVN